MTVVERIHRTGIRRLGGKSSGFRYARAGGAAVSAADRRRIEALKIPPAWREVAIHPFPRGAVQAIGKDAAGRWQYLYHPARTARSEKKKYARLLRFADALPKMRARIAADLALPGLPREKVLACAVKILSDCFMRGGSKVYAEENGSVGLATLRRRHVTVTGDLVRFDFPGKSGKRQEREIRDRRVARIIAELVKGPGEVFKYREDGHWVDLRRRHLNEYIKETMGEAFSAKDFRTWAGTLLCACALARAEADPEQAGAGRKKKMIRAIRETSQRLGNTPAICRASYISPRVLRDYEKGGRVIDRTCANARELLARRSPGLHRAEKALLRLLRREA